MVVQPESEIRELRLVALETGGDVLRKSHRILKYAHESAEAFVAAFDVVRQQRRAGPGATTDEEQDLLRAMLVMAAAGLDSMLKQVIRDGLRDLLDADANVRQELQKFVSRQIRGPTDSDDGAIGHDFLARILIAEKRQDQVVEEYIRHLTGVSLQSVEELRRTTTALGLPGDVIGLPDNDLRTIFADRNRIIHEFDVDFAQLRRNRRSRQRDVMIGYSNALLQVAERVLEALDQKLAAAQ